MNKLRNILICIVGLISLMSCQKESVPAGPVGPVDPFMTLDDLKGTIWMMEERGIVTEETLSEVKYKKGFEGIWNPGDTVLYSATIKFFCPDGYGIDMTVGTGTKPSEPSNCHILYYGSIYENYEYNVGTILKDKTVSSDYWFCRELMSYEFVASEGYINDEKDNCRITHGLSFIDDENARKLKYLGTFEELGIDSTLSLMGKTGEERKEMRDRIKTEYMKIFPDELQYGYYMQFISKE